VCVCVCVCVCCCLNHYDDHWMATIVGFGTSASAFIEIYANAVHLDVDCKGCRYYEKGFSFNLLQLASPPSPASLTRSRLHIAGAASKLENFYAGKR